MNKELYERLYMDVTEFDKEDVIATSGEIPGGGGSVPPNFVPGTYEIPLGI